MVLRVAAHLKDRDAERTLSFLKGLFADYHSRNFAIRLWDGTTWGAESGHHTKFTVVLKHPGALRRMLWPGTELSISQAYLYDDFDIEGDIAAVFTISDCFMRRLESLVRKLRHIKSFLSLPSNHRKRVGRQPARLHGRIHSKQRDREAVTYHYDLSNEFFAQWLDARMVYSCAYFKSSTDDLDQAQEQKLDYICRKLRLRPGQRMLDIGCGWGGLVIFAALRYGVRALGVTLSLQQANWANLAIARAGLENRCRVEVLDYRDLNESEAYDRLVSVGMVEHVGESSLSEYFRKARSLLRPGGMFLNHGISFIVPQRSRRGPTFFDSYVFPDGELVTLGTLLRAAETNGWEVWDVESLREHYILTLQHWLSHLESNHEQLIRIADEPTYRVWRLYMAAAKHQFTIGRTTLYQTLLAKPTRMASEQNLTRSDWYP
jgi:cyclopropane-fatty-acyl-phospholipid synthase